MQIAKQLEEFLTEEAHSHLWVVVSWANVPGLAWLSQHTKQRPVTLLLDRTGPEIFHLRTLVDLPRDSCASVLNFLERDDVSVYSLDHRDGARVHCKNYLIESPTGRPHAALIGSPNLSQYALFQNEETLVRVSPSQLDSVWNQTTSLLDRVQPAADRIANYIRYGQEHLTDYLDSPASINVPAALANGPSPLHDQLRPFLEDWIDQVGRHPCHVQSESNSMRRVVFGWDQLNSVLAQYRLGFPRLRIAQRDWNRQDSNVDRTVARNDDGSRPWVDTAHLYERLNQGGTLVISSIHECDRTLDHLSMNLQRLFGIKANINLYVSLKPERGFGLHWDSHDVVIVQIDGNKHWRIYRPTRPAPLDRDIETNHTEPSEVAMDLVMQPGDMLYIPRGWWHDAIASGVPSMHLTIALRWRTMADYLHWLVDTMLEHEIVREDIPGSLPRQKRKLDLVAELLLKKIGPHSEALGTYLHESTAAIRVHSTPSLPFGLERVALPESAIIRSNCNGNTVLTTTATHITCDIDDRTFTHPIRFKKLLYRLLDAEESTTVEVARILGSDGLERYEVDELLGRLASYGLIRIALPK